MNGGLAHDEDEEEGDEDCEGVGVYNAKWSPHHPNGFASCHADGTVNITKTK